MKQLTQMPKPTAKKALVYCRVSSARQKEQGHGLDSQEHRCRQYAAMHGYGVEQVFPDDVTGGGDFMKRPGMVALIRYLDAHPREDYVVIFDDLKRFARDREFHFKLRHALKLRGASVECLNFRFEDTPEGEFVETVFAAQGQLERQQNSRQVVQKMRACIEAGYYIFGPPLGYKFITSKDGRKMIGPDEPVASILKEALEGFASGRFQTPTEVKRHLDAIPAFPKHKNGEVRLGSLIELMNRPVYAGYITVEKWGIYLRPGKHKPLIDFATWKQIQERLKSKSNAPARKDLNQDFPLRGFVTCGCCDHPLTAGWSKGRNKSYAYYTCQQKGCDDYKKSIRKDKIEGDFEALLKELQPSPCLSRTAWDMLSDLWASRRNDAEANASAARSEMAKLEKKSESLIERLVVADNATLITAYEGEIKKLEEQKIILREKALQTYQTPDTFEHIYRTAMAFLANPWKLWASDLLEHKRMVLRLAFPQRLPYSRNEGYRTAGLAEPFRLLRDLSMPKYGLVELVGIEPTTSCMPCKRSPN